MPLIVALMTMLLMIALGSALTLLTVTETLIAGNYRAGAEALHAADAAAELAMSELIAASDVNLVLAGVVRSAVVDGDPAGVRDTAAGRLDLTELTSIVRCGRVRDCGPADTAAATAARPWGANNPLWQLYAYGPLRDLLRVDSDMYAVVWVGDDPAECDGLPDLDGGPCPDGPNAGRGVVAILAHAYGPGGVRRAVEVTLAPSEGSPPRVLSWRVVQ